jgi:hypothetical protein
MDRVYIEATKSSPKIDFNPQTGILEIEGQSYMENAFKFYKPLFDWMDEFFELNTEIIQVDIRLSYLNTSSIKCLMDIIFKLEQVVQVGKKVKINWYYKSRNILECGEELQEDLEEDLEFNFLKEN